MAVINVEEDYAWAIKYDEEGKPYYYNRFSDRVLLCRPNCFKSGGRVSIREPTIEAQFKGLWYKGLLLGPAESFRFSVKLEYAPVQRLCVSRNRIRKWTKMRRHTVPSYRQRENTDSIADDYDSKGTFIESDNESLSKLSDTFTTTNSADEKYGFKTFHEEGRQFKPPVRLGRSRMILGSRTRSKSLGSPGKQELSNNYWSDEDFNADWMNTMLPLRANPNGEGVGRRQRVNAVILDLQDLRTIHNSLLS